MHAVCHIAPDNGTAQLAMKASIDNQFPGLSAQVFGGKNQRLLPSYCVDELMRAMDDLAHTQTPAVQST